ncbi:MAG: glycosyltransferase family 1 protein [Campylobacterales bacterium]|nr:glycosyltransferase family 1 protein [Campylobacterales bacterium]
MIQRIKNNILFKNLQCFYTKIKYQLTNKKHVHTYPKLDFCKIEKGTKVLYIGTDELQDKSGFLQELEPFCDLKVFTKFDGGYGQYSEKQYLKGYGPDLNIDRLEMLLEDANGRPEVILTQSWARLWDIDKLKLLKQKYSFKFINICMDDRHSFYMMSVFRKYNRGTSGFISLLDGALVTSKESIAWYHAKDIPALYFPEATSSQFFNKLYIEKQYDVGFVGAKYGLRGEYIQYLIDNGIQVKAYGNGWESGRIENEYVNSFFNKCKIVIGFGYILGCNDFMALKLRDFDVPATGSFYLTTYNEDLEELFPEKEGCYFTSKEEMLSKVRYYLANEEEREKIAYTSYVNTIENHVYEERLKLIFKSENEKCNN